MITVKLTQYHTKGFTLIEALVALLVLSIGLLGVAALQITGQRFTYQAYMRTQAATLSYDIMDRIRINSDIAESGAYDNVSCSGDISAPDPNCDVQSCSATEMASYDIAQWCTAVTSILPAGAGSIDWQEVTTGVGKSIHTISIEWLGDRDEDSPPMQQTWTFQQ